MLPEVSLWFCFQFRSTNIAEKTTVKTLLSWK